MLQNVPARAGVDVQKGRRMGMRRFAVRTSAVLLAIGLCLAPSVAFGQDDAVTASDGLIRLPAEGETGTVAVASVKNPGMYAIYLISATSDVAGKVELRDAAKGTQPIEVTVGQDSTTYMDAKGVHMYLSDLKRPLKEGETVKIVLTTDLGVKIEVSAAVKKP